MKIKDFLKELNKTNPDLWDDKTVEEMVDFFELRMRAPRFRVGKGFNVGDTVEIYPYSNFCTGGPATVTNIIVMQDDEGELYDIICFGGHQFDGRTGNALTAPWGYYINVKK